MPKIDSLKEELAVLREEYKNLFLYLLATLTGTITTFYQVLTKKVDFNIVFISLVGFIVATVILVLLREVWSSPDFTDTYKKTDNGPGGVQWKSAENSAESSNMKLYN